MTHNNSYGDNKACESDRDCAKCRPKHPKLKKILLECGEGTGSRTFTSSNDTPFQLGRVTIDTTYLNKPEVLIKFSSIVRMEVLVFPATVRLQYELLRVCDKEEPKSLGILMFEEVNVADDDEIVAFDCEEESFSFIFCECTNCHSCCEYFVTVMPVEITNARATVSNGRMAALSGALCDSLKEEYKTYESKYEGNKLKKKHPKPKETLLACGQGNGNVIFRDLAPQPPAQIAHVAIDTTCLNRSKVLIEFSSIIKIDRDIEDVRLQFELFRMCGDSEPLSRGIWTFERTGVTEDIELEKTFTFIFCDCEVPTSCCEYFVIVTPILLKDIDDDNDDVIDADVIVDNVRMTALAQSLTNCIHHHDCKPLDKKSDCICCVSKSPKPREILLECGSGNGSRTFTSSGESAFQLAQVTIDTTCLCKPMVNIEFSSIVSFNVIEEDGNVQLRYELFRVCDNRRPISLGIWSVERIDLDPRFIEQSTNTFDFTFCDCVTCPGGCEYFVMVTPVTITEGIVTATVSDGRIAALVQELC
ncbi:DUF4489 domain-containing protein [Wukongibacter baidiensis]|uniref:DUF4489 domain-containing protein n=1 Tax=Wukongibacter baidiensis TaxID=1723361 RepID=UPI003D7F3FBD